MGWFLTNGLLVCGVVGRDESATFEHFGGDQVGGPLVAVLCCRRVLAFCFLILEMPIVLLGVRIVLLGV